MINCADLSLSEPFPANRLLTGAQQLHWNQMNHINHRELNKFEQQLFESCWSYECMYTLPSYPFSKTHWELDPMPSNIEGSSPHAVAKMKLPSLGNWEAQTQSMFPGSGCMQIPVHAQMIEWWSPHKSATWIQEVKSSMKPRAWRCPTKTSYCLHTWSTCIQKLHTLLSSSTRAETFQAS